MCCPTLDELPPTHRTGWPWDMQCDPVPAAMPDGRAWPRITVVTPSYNQAEYLEEAIRSVLLQGYPDLEYIVMDGGSADGSAEIIERYSSWITHWESEVDRGQANAINKGLERASGSIFNWINSDDLLTPGALVDVAQYFDSHDSVCGEVENFDAGGDRTLTRPARISAANLIRVGADAVYHQPGHWLRPDYIRECGGIDERYDYIFDLEMMVRYLALHPDVGYIPHSLACFRLHPDSKTVSRQTEFLREQAQATRDLSERLDDPDLRRIADGRARHRTWLLMLDGISSDRSGNAWLRAAHIMLAACHDPRMRFNRPTIGIMLQSCFPRVWTSLRRVRPAR